MFFKLVQVPLLYLRMDLSHLRHITPPHKRRIQASLRYHRILNWLGRIFL